MATCQATTTDPAQLPRTVAVRILAFAYLVNDREVERSTDWETEVKSVNNPLRTVVPLVSKRWLNLINSQEAREVLWRRIRVYDCCIPRHFSPANFAAFWAPRLPYILELDVDLDQTEERKLGPLSTALTAIMGGAQQLQTLRLSGALPVGGMLSSLGSRLMDFSSLSSVYLSGGVQATWHLENAVQALAMIPALDKLEIRFNNDYNINGTNTSVLDALCDLSTLRHLSLQWPTRSALPPREDFPDRISALSSLTTLQIKRVPVQKASPAWLASLPALKHLYWDPYLPADIMGSVPSHITALQGLRTLYLEMRPPLYLPPGLTALERLALVGRGLLYNGDENNFGGTSYLDWEWLDSLTCLVSLRLQGGGIVELPESVRKLAALTRLELMCNDLTAEALLPGPWVETVRHLHLGCNQIEQFPSVLRNATSLQSLHLANQRCVSGVIQGPSSVMQRLKMSTSDVAALLAAPKLEIVVMGMTQPQVQVKGRICDFDWLQRVLRQRRRADAGPIKVTSNELAYELEPMEVFKVQHLTAKELQL